MLNFKYFKEYHSNEIELNIRSIEVAGDVRRLRDRWTPEIAQDLETFHYIDAEQELTRMLSEEISREIDNNIILPMVR